MKDWTSGKTNLCATFRSFDTGTHPSGKEPERFYHGFFLGLLVDRAKDYLIKSNRESGEISLGQTADNALRQIEEKKYEADLIARGIPAEKILKYGFGFAGEKCLIKMAGCG